MQVLGLFSGIGGFELGFRRAGFTIAGVCEIEPYAQRVLAKHFPEAKLYTDVKELTGERLRQDGINPYVVTGGFPCQDISLAGKGAGLNGDRSGLWWEMHRVIAETRPRWVVCENVAALRSRGLDQVLGSLAQIGYDAEWHCIPASAVGAPHRRDRIWIVAYPARVQPGWAEQRAIGQRAGQGGEPQLGSAPDDGSGAGRALPATGRDSRRVLGAATVSAATRADVADTDCDAGHEGRPRDAAQEQGRRHADRGGVKPHGLGHPDEPRLEIRLDGYAGQQPAALGTGWWQSEPDVGRVVARFSPRLDGTRLDGSSSVGGTGKILRALQNALHTETLQWPVGGFGRIQTAKVLLDSLLQHEGKARPLGHVSLSCAETPQITIRGVWHDGAVACASCRRTAAEQRGREHPNALRILPQLLACDCGATWLDATGTPTSTSRVDRLRALGNSVVPQIPEIIAHAIRDYEFI